MKIGVLYGGWSREKEVSIRSGKNVASALRKKGYDVVEIDVDRDLPIKLKDNKVEFAYIMLHGSPGEDGTIQGLLEIMGIGYTGSGVKASACAIDKITSKKIFLASGVNTPRFLVPEGNLQKFTQTIPRKLGFPVVVKPRFEGSSIGISIIKSPDKLLPTIKETMDKFGDVLLEEYIEGKDITVGIVGDRALPILELVPKNEFYDYEAKYTKGKTEFIIPARLDDDLTKIVKPLALKAYNAIECADFGRVDMRVRENEPYVLEVNTIPGMTEISDLPAQAKADGISYEDLVEKILLMSIKRWENKVPKGSG